jgi:general nucleoside transport system ATP-binding protein
VDLALRADAIDKSYGTVRANVAVSVDIRRGEIHAILGENGAGKSTLMRILYGMEVPDSGVIQIDSQPTVFRSPRDAIRVGVGMVHQHFMLVPTLTVLENLMLGNEIAGRGIVNFREARASVLELASRFHISVDLDQKVSQLSVGEQQRVEILKVLVRRARILILDEPTAVLMPQEIADFMISLRQLAEKGFSIFIVTHKLSEAMQVSDRVSVMRGGRMIGTWKTSEVTPDALIAHMIGHDRHVHLARRETEVRRQIIWLRDLRVEGDRGRDALRGLDLTIQGGEILGIAGVEGNGQRELAEAIIGLREIKGGHVELEGENVAGRSTIDILHKGVGFIPEDRHHDALVLSFSVAENAVLTNHSDPPFERGGMIVPDAVSAFAKKLVNEFQIRCASVGIPMRNLSGGNQQKLVLGRELSRNLRLLIAMQPTRGLDVGAIDYVHSRLIEARNRGTAVLLISTELDEVMALSDRIAVIREGRIVGTLTRAEATMEGLGRLMLGSSQSASAGLTDLTFPPLANSGG